MYEANTNGQSALALVMQPSTGLEVADKILKLFIADFKFDAMKETKLDNSKGNSTYLEILNQATEAYKWTPAKVKLFEEKLNLLFKCINFNTFNFEKLS